MHELARLLGSATLGAALGIICAVYGKTDPGWAAVIVVSGLVAITAFSLIYYARMERHTFLDSYEECRGDCRGQLRRRQLWRLPPDLHEKKGLPVCSSCFREKTGRTPNPFEDKLAYAKKGEEHENTSEGKRERKQWEENRLRFQEALGAPVTEESLRANLIDPLGRQRPEVRQALEKLIRETAANSRSPQSPKRDP